MVCVLGDNYMIMPAVVGFLFLFRGLDKELRLLFWNLGSGGNGVGRELGI